MTGNKALADDAKNKYPYLPNTYVQTPLYLIQQITNTSTTRKKPFPRL